MYKDKFSEWGFYKNLPREKAQWMLNKAEQRKDQLPEPKETVFVCRGREWTEEVLRNKVKGAKFEGDLDEATPQDTTYMTPRPLNVPSPGSARTPKEPSIPAERWTPTPFSGNTQPRFLRLTWNGQTLEALKALRNSAHELDREGDFQNAEGKLREVLAGFENLLSPTHEDTNAVAYELATLYAGHDRMNDADLVLNWMGENHVERWGPNHRKTQTHFLRVVDLFNSWSRSNDAMTFLYRVLDALDKHDSVGTRRNNTSNFDSPLVAQAHVGPPHIAAQQPGPEYVASAVAGTDDPARVDYQLGLARSRTAAFDEAAEPLLLSLIEQCDKYPERLNSQILQARCALLDLYQRLGDDERVASGLDQAKEVLEKILPSTKKTKHFLEACIKVAELHVKNDYCQSAEDMFQTIGCEVEDTFGIDHENTIELLICIGKIFQRQNQWDNARPWFERALAASMTRNGLQSTMTKRLEAALENQRYSVTALMHEELESIVRSSSLDTPWRG
ncbi:hypothetical protein FGG08_003906 [Glutinoglossum americanum]|uniref:Clr5 domain-containing protein n=1 Tax=Glutinoglossum americanum TaxID=1670608 RepID=A0A9P8I3D0_9PEZI|nr:hypothetical protein FGG08_003906 [Glutinoglossum americanum]